MNLEECDAFLHEVNSGHHNGPAPIPEHYVIRWYAYEPVD